MMQTREQSLHRSQKPVPGGTRLGGAQGVKNLVSLGAATSIFSVIGKDEAGKSLDALMTEQGIDTSYIICSSTRKTTDKTRIISRNQQMMRLDAETTADLVTTAEDALIGVADLWLETRWCAADTLGFAPAWIGAPNIS